MGLEPFWPHKAPRWALPHGASSCRLPAVARLARLLGVQQKRCLACEVVKQPDLIACITPGCKGRSPSPHRITPPFPHSTPQKISPPPLSQPHISPPHPPGLYCSQCYKTLSNVCSVCMGPLCSGDSGDEEM